MRFRLLILVPALAAFAHAQDQSPVEPKSLPAPDQVVEPVTPSVKKIDATRYQVGDVVFDQKTREIRFPTLVNMTEGLLEFLIVHEKGKVHESLLTTAVSPTHLNLAFTLLRYSPSKELYLLPDENGKVPTEYPHVPAEVKAAARVVIDVEWSDGGETRRIPINEWIQHAVKTTSMLAGPWVYGGSDFSEGIFLAETSGDVAAIYLSMAALLNYPGNDNDSDEVWVPFPKRVPPQGTKVTVIIAPYRTAESLPKP
ncbi:MAG: YdjY domain-containing protein [Luteolibacter sp.]